MEHWAKTEMAGAQLGHERFRKNAIEILSRIGSKEGLSFSAACGPAVRKSANRLFTQSDIDLQKGHVDKTVKRCVEAGMVLALEDTTDVNYNSHKSKQGMGLLGGQFVVKGINIHSVLCVSTAGEPLGLIGQHIWAPVPSKSKADGVSMSKLAIEEKESMKWIRLMRDVNQSFEAQSLKVLVVADREADFYEHFSEPRRANVELLVRGSHLDRRIEFEGHQCQTRDLPKLSEVKGCYKLTVSKQQGREKREAKITVRYGQLSYPPTRDKTGGSIKLWFVHAEEIGYNGKDKIEWYLYTTIPIETLEQAFELIAFYSKRWIIERFHYVLKTGLQIERIQIDTFERLKNALHLYGIVGWRILWLNYIGKAKPESKAEPMFDKPQIEVLEAVNQKKINTVRDFLLSLGKLVGFQTSTKQPLPGEKLLWQAYGQLLNIQKGIELAQIVKFSGTG